MQYGRAPEGGGPERGNGAKARPAGVKVEYFASVRRQTPRPITPSSMRFSKNVAVPAQQTETTVFGHEVGTEVRLPVTGSAPRIRTGESGSFVPTHTPDFPCSNNVLRPGTPLGRANCGQNVPFVSQELRPSIPQHPRQPNVNLTKAGLDCTLPPHRGALPHGRPQPPPPGEGCVPPLDAGNVWPTGRRHQHPMFAEAREGFPRSKAVLPPADHEHMEDYHLEQPEDHPRYRGFRPSAAATEEGEFDERQSWLTRRSWGKGCGGSAWVEADANGRLGDDVEGQTAARKVLPLMSIRSFPTRQFSGSTHYYHSYYN